MEVRKDNQLKRLFSSFPQTDVTDVMAELLTIAAEANSYEALEKAVNDFVFGRVPRHNMAFMPSVAEFTDRLEKIQGEIDKQDNQRRAAKKSAFWSGTAPPATQAEKERVRALVRKYHETVGEGKTGRPMDFALERRRQSFTQGRKLLAENVTEDAFEKMGRSGEAPPGSRWAWENGNVYGPKEGLK